MTLEIFVSVVQAQPARTCGSKLTERISRICETRGGYRSSTHRRYRRGVYNDCCQRKCTDESLHAYCNSDHELMLAERSEYRAMPEDHVPQDLLPVEQSTDNAIEKITSTVDPKVLADIEFRKRTRIEAEVGTVAPEYNIRPILRWRKSS